MKRANVWSNSDGLGVGFGTRDVETVSGAALSTRGGRKEVVLRIEGAQLGATPTTAQLMNGAVIPAGSYIEECKLIVNTAFSDVNGELDIGGYNYSTLSVDDEDGFDASVDVALLVADYELACDGSYVGKVLANSIRVGASYDTAAFTDGVATVIITYIPPVS